MFEDTRPSIMLATMAIFLTTIVVLNTMLYRPPLKFMNERNDSTKNDENKVKENSQGMLGANDKAEAIHVSTREETHKTKQNAINTTKEEAQQAVKARKEELERRMANFYTELVFQEKELQDHLSVHSPDPKQAL